MPGHLATVAHVRKTQLGVLLITAAFLTLAGRINVVFEPSITTSVHVIHQGAVEQGAVVGEDGDCHHRL